jgi:hypothetical protein
MLFSSVICLAVASVAAAQPILHGPLRDGGIVLIAGSGSTGAGNHSRSKPSGKSQVSTQGTKIGTTGGGDGNR